MSFAESIVLAIIEGLTEFLPISSTGHMIVAASVMGIADEAFTKAFIVAIQLGAILSVVVLYWRKFIPGTEKSGVTIEFYTKLFVAFLPAAILGLLLHRYIDELLGRVEVVGTMLVLGGIVFLFIDRLFPESRAVKTEVTYPSALRIGFFQTISIALPGISRSAATIIGGLTQRLTRKSAAEFSFFLAVPTMFAATAYKLFEFYRSGEVFGSHEITLLLIGNAVSFVVALLVIRTFVQFLTKHGFKIFGYYRIAAGLVTLLLYYLGVELSVL